MTYVIIKAMDHSLLLETLETLELNVILEIKLSWLTLFNTRRH
jgi:hypothetical protein